MHFKLHSFEPQSQVEIAVEVSRSHNLELSFEVGRGFESLTWPPFAPVLERKDRLWESTCLECFVGISGRPEYWELNLSPSGDWNFYFFQNERKQMCVEDRIQTLKPAVLDKGMGCSLDLTQLGVTEDQELELNLAAVLEFHSGEKAYFALKHLGGQPDFHRRDGFVAKV